MGSSWEIPSDVDVKSGSVYPQLQCQTSCTYASTAASTSASTYTDVVTCLTWWQYARGQAGMRMGVGGRWQSSAPQAALR